MPEHCHKYRNASAAQRWCTGMAQLILVAGLIYCHRHIGAGFGANASLGQGES
jgi:hypothetical protein